MIFTVILASILLVFSGVIYWILSTTVYKELDYAVKFQAQEISDNINLYLTAKKNEPGNFEYAIQTTIAREVKPRQRWWTTDFDRRWERKIEQQDLSNVYINLTTLNGQSLKASSNMSEALFVILKKNIRFSTGAKDDFFNVKIDGRVIRMCNYPFIGPDGTSYVLQVGISQEPTILILQDWMNKVLMSIPIILILTSFMGGLMANRILHPVEKMAALAQQITQADLSKRVTTKKRYDYKEMAPVVDSFNEMISRLEKSFHHIRNFSSHIAHELKTPLTILRGETELALMSPRSPEEYQATLNTSLEETQAMLKIIDDLLFFTRMEHHPGWFKFEPIDFVVYIKEIVEQSAILAKRKQIKIECQLPANTKIIVNGDPLHLRRLFFNLIDNAIKFSPEKSRIEISVNTGDGRVIVRVKDQGRGITKKDADKIFDLFYCADTTSGGNGLGLSIAQTIAKAHGGLISVTEKAQQPPGAEFIVSLPTAHI